MKILDLFISETKDEVKLATIPNELLEMFNDCFMDQPETDNHNGEIIDMDYFQMWVDNFGIKQYELTKFIKHFFKSPNLSLLDYNKEQLQILRDIDSPYFTDIIAALNDQLTNVVNELGAWEIVGIVGDVSGETLIEIAGITVYRSKMQKLSIDKAETIAFAHNPNFEWSRKPGSVGDIDELITTDNMSDIDLDIFDGLAVYVADDAYFNVLYFGINNKNVNEKVFILDCTAENGKKYLINTEEYDYCRYVAELDDESVTEASK